MRIPRSLQLIEDSAYVSITWKCHNNAYLLKNNSSKSLYVSSIKKTLKNILIGENVKILAFCIMDNHVHMLIYYKNGSSHLSDFLRSCHSRFGLCFNRIHERSGKVANERPHSSLIEDFNHIIKVHLYIEANPIKARMHNIETLKKFKYSTFRLFAFGHSDEFNDFITIPSWYMSLGKTNKERQRNFLRIFLEYISNINFGNNFLKQSFIGSQSWVSKYQDYIALNLLLRKRFNST